MPGENLTRVETQGRKALVDAKSYEVVLDLTTGDTTFGSTTTAKFSAKPGSSTWIDAITAKVHSVTLNGVSLDPAEVNKDSRIQLDNLAAENTLVVVSDAMYTNTGEGLHRFVDPVDGEVYLYSQFEVPDTRRVFAVFEQPDLKATFQFTVIAPSAWKVVSNSITPTPTDGPSTSSGTSKTWTFAPTHVLSPYVTAIIAGPYEMVESSLTSRDGRNIPLAIYSRRSLTEYVDAHYIFDITRKGFEYYEEIFGFPYPFDKYDQLFVPEFNAGAMENAGAVTFVETYVFRSKVTDAIRERRVVTILHELAHMWFGDLVTMKWWNDLWLNESFAEWAAADSSAEVTEWTEAWTTFAMMEKSWAYLQDQLPSTHPVFAAINDLEDVQVNFDGITYAKGGSVLKQLVSWVGLDAFLEGLRAYFKKYQFGNSELADLLGELETTSGRKLGEWSKVWLETAGVNTLRPEIETDADGVITSFTIRQTASADYPTIRPHRIGVGLYDLHDSGKVIRVDRLELDVSGETTVVADLVGRKRPALVLLNDDDLTYAKIRLDDASLAVATEHLADIENSLARALVWGAAWDAMRDGETKASDYVQLVLRNIATETESTTIRVALTQLLTTARYYVAPARRDQVIAEVGDALLALAQGAAPASDAQFQFVKFFANIASTADHVKALHELRDGASDLKGLEIDADLDWELLEGLVINGAAGKAEIDLKLAKDNTATGQQAAARVAAAIPTAKGKQETFGNVISRDDIANLILRNTGVGYQHTNDPSSLKDMIEPYFDAITSIWKSRSYKIAEYIVEGFYPSPLVSQELVDATKAWLKANDDIPALRRLVIENLAGVERALVAQAKDK